MEEVRAFLRDFVDSSNLREAEATTGVGHEAIRKFCDGTTRTPHRRSLRAFTTLYWRMRGAVAEAPADPDAWELRSVLPAGLDAGLAALERIIARDPATGERSEEAARVYEWAVRRLDFEYGTASHHYKKRKKPRR